MLLNYLDISKFLVILIIILMVFTISIIFYINLSLISGIFIFKSQKTSCNDSPHISIKSKKATKVRNKKMKEKVKFKFKVFIKMKY